MGPEMTAESETFKNYQKIKLNPSLPADEQEYPDQVLSDPFAQ